MKHSFFYGSTFSSWWEVLKQNNFAVHPAYWHHAALITGLSMHNSCLALAEKTVARESVDVDDPVFVLGHWRSGTTHLHNLLSLSPELAAPTSFEVCYPHSFLRFEELHARLLSPFVPNKRPQDNMRMAIDTPNEDEIGLTTMGLPSPYLACVFPANENYYRRFLSFREATEVEREKWKSGFVAYVDKLQQKHGKQLVLKSPGHTARIGMIRECYPNARFVHVHRDPYRVFQSTRHLHQTWFKNFAFLQPPRMDELDAFILWMYQEMYAAYDAEVGAIPDDRLFECSFDELETAPEETVENLCGQLGMADFSVRDYVRSLKSYRKNSYEPLAEVDRAVVRDAWGFAFGRWGYEREA